MPILSFRDAVSEDTSKNVVSRETLRRLPLPLFGPAIKKLALLDSAGSLLTLKEIRSLRLEMLKGSRKGYFSIRINIKYRICFYWLNGDAYDVEIVDYH